MLGWPLVPSGGAQPFVVTRILLRLVIAGHSGAWEGKSPGQVAGTGGVMRTWAEASVPCRLQWAGTAGRCGVASPCLPFPKDNCDGHKAGGATFSLCLLAG